MNIISNFTVDGHPATKDDRLQKVRELTESGDEYAISHYMDVAFHLFTLGAEYVDNAMELLGKYGLNEKKIKMKSDNFNASFDALNKAIYPLYESQQAQTLTCNNYDAIKEVFEAIMEHKHLTIVRGAYYQPKLFLPQK